MLGGEYEREKDTKGPILSLAGSLNSEGKCGEQAPHDRRGGRSIGWSAGKIWRGLSECEPVGRPVFLFGMMACRAKDARKEGKQEGVRIARIFAEFFGCSQRPSPKFPTSGIPRGQRNCTVLMSSPINFRSSAFASFRGKEGNCERSRRNGHLLRECIKKDTSSTAHSRANASK